MTFHISILMDETKMIRLTFICNNNSNTVLSIQFIKKNSQLAVNYFRC